MTRDIEVLRTWIRIVSLIAAIGTTSVPILYSFSPWRKRQLGRLIMYQAISFAVAMDVSTVFSFWHPSDILVLFWVDAALLTAIAFSTSAITYWVWKMNFYHGRNIKVKFTNRVYDVLKFIAQVGLPAAGTLYFSLASLWHLPNPDEVVGTVVIVDTFLGTVLHLSTSAYNANTDKFDGSVSLVPNDEGTAVQFKGMDLEGMASKPFITLKVVPTPQSAPPAG